MTHRKETALKVNNVVKDFHIPHHTTNSVKDTFLHALRKKDKSSDTFHALKGISFQVNKGDFFGVVGRNGAGKSTLLRIMAQIYQPTSGGVYVKGKLVPFIELGVGFNANLSARDNVYLNGAMLGFSKREMDERYDSIVEFADLKEFMDLKLKNFSSGMRVRLAFSVAIQADADILLLDEVLAVGDTAFKKKCYEYFDTLKKNKKTIIFVSHSMGAIREYCNRAVLIEDGKIACEGTADEVADKYAQLFQKNIDVDEKRKKNESDRRWGSRRVYMDSIKLSKTKDKIKVDVSLVAGDEAIDSAKFGVSFKNNKGIMVAGFNNINTSGGEEMKFAANEQKILSFEMENIFNQKEYIATATLVSNDDTEVYDKWREFATVSNDNRSVPAPYATIIPGKVNVRTVD